MKSSLIACVAALALLTACSSDDSAAGASGTGGATEINPNGAGQGVGRAGLGGGAGRSAPGTQEDLAQSAGDRILFDSDQSRVNDKARAVLDRQVAWLRQYPQVSVWVAGNCDERGTDEYNLALGQRRANADRAYLIANGIAKSRIETISYGKQRPVNAASNADGWAENRNAITSVK